MAKKNLKNEIRNKDKDEKEVVETVEVKTKPKKKKMTSFEKKKLVFKIVGIVMGAIMFFGTLISFLAPFIYK